MGPRSPRSVAAIDSPSVVIEDFADYDMLFPHVDIVVTNGGFGTTLAALRHGVPVVGAGKREGKNDVNARVHHIRLGIDLRTERPKPARIAAAVRQVLMTHRSPRTRPSSVRS